MGRASLDQSAYYERTAAGYADAHMTPRDEHYVALEYASALMRAIGAETVLDVGAGVGRGVSFVAQREPRMRVIGVEPSAALIREASAGLTLVQGSGMSLPFPDKSVDVVVSTGVLHHVPQANVVIAEMTRIARRAVFVSDANRFGQGPLLARLAKLVLCRIGLWETQVRIRTKGSGAFYSEGDGVFYSYSAYDSYASLEAWADRIFVIPTARNRRRPHSPLLSAPSILVCAIREPGSFGVP